nr:retrovirus-related Pol polyprotein from transposon TNT 1-94 [Tanacetum cinerariifolium]
QKGKRVKRSAKKSSTTPTTGIVIREPPVETQSKRKEKSLRDVYKSHPSGSGSVAENPPSVDKITPPVTSEGTGDKPGVPDVTKDESTESESESWGNDEDDSNNEEDSKYDQQDNDDDEVKDVDDDEEDDDNNDDKSEDVSELKNDPLHTQVTTLVDDHLSTRMGATREEFMNFLSASLTDRITKQVKNQMPQILPEEVSNFAPPVIEKMIQESLDQRSRDDKDKDEGPSTRSDRGLKKRKTSKDAEPTTKFKVGDTDTPQDQEGNQGNDNYKPRTESASRRAWFTKPLRPAFRLLKGTRSNYAKLKYDFEECYKALSEKLDWENPEGADYPFDLSKPLPLITRGNRQSVPVEFFINNDLKYLQGGISTMTYTTSTTKTKAT